MRVEEFLENSARQYPNKVALIVGEERLTYRQIDEESEDRLAHALIAAGVVRGDRVVTFLPYSALAVFAICATLKAGAVFVVLNPTTKPDKLTYILSNCRASRDDHLQWWKAFFRSDLAGRRGHIFVPCSCWSASEVQNCYALRSVGKSLIPVEEVRQDKRNIQPPSKKCINIDLAALIYTSGSTSVSQKG